MRFRKIFIILFYAIFLAVSFSDADAMEGKRGRPYEIGRDIGFRWRTTLNVQCGSLLIGSDTEHERLRELIDGCDEAFRVNGANVAAASLQVVFKDSFSKPAPIEAIVYARDLRGMQARTRVSCFSTACLTIGEGSQARHPPITYKNRETLENSIPFIFEAIGMNTDCVKATSNGYFQYDYRDTEFQIVHELFSTKECGFVPGKNRRERGSFRLTERKSRFVELFTSVMSGRRLEDVALTVLHIHTKFDPCAVCAEMLCKLSQTLNYRPEKLIQNEELCQRLRDHHIQFLIEVSSDDLYWNSREAGLDSFYMRQLADISGLGRCPIKIPSIEECLQNQMSSFPPLVVFRRILLPIVFDSRIMINAETQTTPARKDKETNTGIRKRRNSI